MNPKSGTAGSAVAPAEPKEATEADVADPGKTQELAPGENSSQADPYDSQQLQPHKPPQKGAGSSNQANQANQKKSWIEIELVDEDDKPVPGERYKIILPDNATVAEGTLDEKGFARVDGIDPGTCKITFPELDKDAWKKV